MVAGEEDVLCYCLRNVMGSRSLEMDSQCSFDGLSRDHRRH